MDKRQILNAYFDLSFDLACLEDNNLTDEEVKLPQYRDLYMTDHAERVRQFALLLMEEEA